MKFSQLFRRLPAISILLVGLIACTGGGEGGTGIVSTGRITDTQTDSVTVNNVKFVTTNARISNDGTEVLADQLELGVVVTVKGTVDKQNNGVADSIELGGVLRGSVQAIDAGNGNYTVLEQTVIVDPDPSITLIIPPPVGNIQVNDFVEINGFVEAGGIIRASRIEYIDMAEFEEYEIIGFATNIDITANQFSIGPLTINYTDDLLDESLLVDNVFVEVEGDLLVGTILTAKEIEFESEIDDGLDYDLEGLVTNVNTVQKQFTLQSTLVQWSDTTTIFDDGIDAADIINGAYLHVEGYIEGGILIAEQIAAESL